MQEDTYHFQQPDPSVSAVGNGGLRDSHSSSWIVCFVMQGHSSDRQADNAATAVQHPGL